MVEYLEVGDKIDYDTYNAIVYLLRKFKRLTTDLRLGQSVLNTDYGTLAISGGLTSLGGNFIIESPVTVSSNDCLQNCFYSLVFTVIDRNLSGTVNRRVATVTGDTGEDGELEITIPTDLISSDEVILPDFKLDIVFDEHEYYTPISDLNIRFSFRRDVALGETASISAIVTDNNGHPVPDLDFQFYIGGTHQLATTNSQGVATVTYTGVGLDEWLSIYVGNEYSSIYDGEVLTAEFYGDTITIGHMYSHWLLSNGYVVIDWGDGTSTTVNYYEELIGELTHDYDFSDYYTIRFIGNITELLSAFKDCTGLTSVTFPDTVTRIGTWCFSGCTGLTSVTLPDSLTSLEYECFSGCTGLTSITIPDSITSIGGNCFWGCTALVDYQLYWESSDSIITYSSDNMPAGEDTVFTIPYGTTSLYTAKNYPSAKLVERSPVPDTLTVTADHDIIQSTETSTITALLTDNGQGVPNKTLNYEIRHGDTTITTGSDTTDSNGEIEINYTGTGTGEISIIVSYGTLLQETFVVTDTMFYDEGTTGTPNSDWWKSRSSITLTGDNTGLTVANSTTSTLYLAPNKPTTSGGSMGNLVDWNDFICEFIYHECLNTNYLRLETRDINGNVNYKSLHGMNLSDGDIVRIEYTDDTLKYYKNGVQDGSKQTTCNGLVMIRFAVNNNSLRFSNFKVYPI